MKPHLIPLIVVMQPSQTYRWPELTFFWFTRSPACSATRRPQKNLQYTCPDEKNIAWKYSDQSVAQHPPLDLASLEIQRWPYYTFTQIGKRISWGYGNIHSEPSEAVHHQAPHKRKGDKRLARARLRPTTCTTCTILTTFINTITRSTSCRLKATAERALSMTFTREMVQFWKSTEAKL